MEHVRRKEGDLPRTSSPRSPESYGAPLRIRRRTFLAGLGAAAAGSWLYSRDPDLEGESLPRGESAFGPEPMGDQQQTGLSLFSLGDIGWNNPVRARVIARMVEACRDARPSFITLTGDNFYLDGVQSTDD